MCAVKEGGCVGAEIGRGRTDLLEQCWASWELRAGVGFRQAKAGSQVRKRMVLLVLWRLMPGGLGLPQSFPVSRSASAREHRAGSTDW